LQFIIFSSSSRQTTRSEKGWLYSPVKAPNCTAGQIRSGPVGATGRGGLCVVAIIFLNLRQRNVLPYDVGDKNRRAFNLRNLLLPYSKRASAVTRTVRNGKSSADVAEDPGTTTDFVRPVQHVQTREIVPDLPDQPRHLAPASHTNFYTYPPARSHLLGALTCIIRNHGYVQPEWSMRRPPHTEERSLSV